MVQLARPVSCDRPHRHPSAPAAADHKALIPLVELSLAIMRLSCERFFSLMAVSGAAVCCAVPCRAAARSSRAVFHADATLLSVYLRGALTL